MKKTLSLILAFVMLLSVTAGLNISVFARDVETVALTGITAPIAGESPVFSAEDALSNSGYSINTFYYTNGIKWVDTTSGEELSESDKFVAGNSYTVYVRLLADRGNSFSGNISCDLDGAVAGYVDNVVPGSLDSIDFYFTFSNTIARQTVYAVEINNFTEPTPEAAISYSYTFGTSGYSLDETFGNSGIKIRKYDGKDYFDISPEDKYEAGYSYRVEFKLLADRGYKFAIEDGESAVNATVNGETVNRYTFRAADDTLFVDCSFECKYTIDKITLKVSNLNAYADEKPTYEVASDDFVKKDPPSGKYYNYEQYNETTEKGICFYDETDKKVIRTTDTFKYNHQYSYYVMLIAGTRYKFADLGKLKATISGLNATVTNIAPDGHSSDASRIVYVKYKMAKSKYNIFNASVHSIAKQTYTGKALTPKVTLEYKGVILEKGTDYTISYSNNVNSGSAQVHVTGKGKYTGSFNTGFYIKPKKISPTVTLSATQYKYDRKTHRPTVKKVVYDGKTLVKDKDYTVTYGSKDAPSSVGIYYVNVVMKGNYTGSKSPSYKIIPQTTGFKNTEKIEKTAYTVHWKRQKSQTSGYQIEIATNKTFTKNSKTYTVSDILTTSKRITGLKKNTRYFIRIRTYKNVTAVNGGKTKVYSEWSGYKYFTTKKK